MKFSWPNQSIFVSGMLVFNEVCFINSRIYLTAKPRAYKLKEISRKCVNNSKEWSGNEAEILTVL